MSIASILPLIRGSKHLTHEQFLRLMGIRYPSVRFSAPEQGLTVNHLLQRITDAVEAAGEDPFIVRRFVSEAMTGPRGTRQQEYAYALAQAAKWFNVQIRKS